MSTTLSVFCVLAATAAGLTINMLQWNPHWECFNAGRDKVGCANNVRSYLTKILREKDIDFANIIEVAGWSVPSEFGSATGKCGLDTSVLLYRKSRWKAITGSKQGCMDFAHGKPDRPFIAQGFQSTKQSCLKLVGVGAHYPHNPKGRDVLKSGVASLGSQIGSDLVLFMADTNTDASNNSVMREFVANTNNIQGNELFHSCCHDNAAGGRLEGRFGARYDRAITNFGRATKSELLLDPPPAWTKVDRQSRFHKPVFFALSSTECAGRSVAALTVGEYSVNAGVAAIVAFTCVLFLAAMATWFVRSRAAKTVTFGSDETEVVVL